ncbi:MAG: redoxin domain-containing protein [candidate division Zixibacteria bacterium]
MGINDTSTKTNLMYIMVGGLVVFLAISLAIPVGMALSGQSGIGELSPETLPNRTNLTIGQTAPALELKNLNGRPVSWADITQGKPTVVAVVLPGCQPCERILNWWENNGYKNGKNGINIVLLASLSSSEIEFETIMMYEHLFPIYTTGINNMRENYGITGYPTMFGLDSKNDIKFVTHSFLRELDYEFFKEYL